MRSCPRLKIGIAAVALMCLGGCTTLPEPHLAYTDSGHPLADTAIIDCGLVESSWCFVTDVDGLSVKNALGGYRRWVRVLPGQHKVGIQARVVGRVGFADVEIATQPRHVYEVRIHNVSLAAFGGTFHPVVIDLGEHSSYEIHDGGPTGRVIGVAKFQ